MSKLSILGAQRVKALIEVLKDKEKAEIREVELQKPPRDEVEEQVDGEFEVSNITKELTDIEARVKEISRELTNKTGRSIDLEVRTLFRDERYKEYSNRVREVMSKDVDEEIERIKQDYRRREQMLWLCETLEEAKEIVGMNN